MKACPTIFLDRDGTLVEDVGYLRRREDIRIIPGALQAVKRANDSGFLVLVVSNQSGVARGLLAESEVREIQNQIDSMFQAQGARLDGFYYCPHHPEQGEPPYRKVCNCRKPAPGLLQQAAAEWPIDFSRSYMVGDSLRDLEAGGRMNCGRVLVLTGYGKQQMGCISQAPLEARPDFVANDIAEAIDWILS